MAKSPNTLRAYKGIVTRLVEGAERLSEIKGEDPRLIDLFNAMVMRAPTLSKQSINVEIYALRDLIARAQFDPMTGAYSPQPEDPQNLWLMSTTRDDWFALSEKSKFPASQVIEYAQTAISEIENHPAIQSAEIDGYEVIERAGLRKHHQKERKSLKDEAVIQWRHIKNIEMLLSHHDPYKALASVEQGHRIDAGGLTRMFATTMWSTGARPVELWSSIVLVPRVDRPMTDEVRQLIRDNPRHAINDRHLIPIEKLERSPRERYGHALLRATGQTGAPAILAIKSAKMTNANPALANPVRLQILENMPIEIADMVALSAQLRHFHATAERQEMVRRAVNDKLKEIVRGEPALQDMKPTLYAFRHAFATRIKRFHQLHEAAALIGHTSAQSTYRYGKRGQVGTRSGVTRNAANWMPEPDPVQSQLIAKAWGYVPKTPEISGPDADLCE